MNTESSAARRKAGGDPLPWRCLLGLLITLPAWFGCANTHRFTVDAVKNDAEAESRHAYRIVITSPAQSPGSAEVQEAVAYVRTALSAKGMYEAPPGTPVDAVIEIDFGAEPPQRRIEIVQRPAFRTVTHRERVSVPAVDADGRPTTIDQSYTWTEQVLHGTKSVREVVFFIPKFLRITARETPEAAGTHPPRELWSVYVTNNDTDPDFTKYLPLLVAAAMDSLDENASGTRDVVIRDGDERITFVRRGI